jgi:glycerate 2-kinase
VNILVAPDSFKGSLTALEAADAMVQGIREVIPEAEIASLPLADGGEGTVEALVTATRGRMIPATVTGPLGDPVEAVYGVLGDDVTGVVEMAQAAGLTLLSEKERNPLLTTTRGVGELMLAALDAGCTKLIVGLGGSATNDGGAGMAQALGARLLGADGRDLRPGAAHLMSLARIDTSSLDPRLARVTVSAASDVTNPLCGPEGASAVYGPQKGASPQIVGMLDKALAHYAEIIARDLGKEVSELPGAGAAGGLGAGLVAFCDAKIRSGANLVLEMFEFDTLLESADVVFTGEGRIDAQTAFGKAISVVALLAEKHGVPVVAFTGSLQVETRALARRGVAGVVPITSSPMTEAEAIAGAGELLQTAVERTVRLLQLGAGIGGRWGGAA